jgi:hypothetical protein
MKLTPELKNEIDLMGVYGLLHGVRFHRAGAECMQGESGEYWMKRLAELREQDNDAYVRASKDMGWKE